MNRLTETFGSLVGRTAVVTGSSTGLGRAIAIEFARGGANVVVHCRSSVDEAEQTAAVIRDSGREAAVITRDLGALSAESAAAFVNDCYAVFGGADVWVNNAGVDLLTGPDAELGYAEKLERLLAVDVRSTVLLGQEVGRRMRQSGDGVVLNIGWDQADRGMDGASGELFAASKNAIMGFTRSLAVSLAPDVRVNCIAPGWIRTAWGAGASDYWQQRVLEETPLRRWGEPEDIATMARFLCSDSAAFITGQVINVNGGAVR